MTYDGVSKAIYPKHGQSEPIRGWNPKDLSKIVKISKFVFTTRLAT
jgi:hypothetical protein